MWNYMCLKPRANQEREMSRHHSGSQEIAGLPLDLPPMESSFINAANFL